MPNKAVAFEFKDADPAKGIVTGNAAVYGNIDDGLDIIEPGAGAKTLAERGNRIKVLWMHDRTKILGVPLEITEKTDGLYTVTKFTLDSFWGKEIHSHVMNQNPDNGARAVDGMSIGYSVVQASTDPDNYIRKITEYKLYEYSFVDLGMNPAAMVDGAKSSLLDFLGDGEFERLIMGALKNATPEQIAIYRKAHAAFSKAVASVEPERKDNAPQLTEAAMVERAAALRKADLIRAQTAHMRRAS